MSNHFRIPLVMAAFLLIIILAGISKAANLAPAWKEPPVADGSFFDVMFSADGSTVYAGVTRCLSVPETEPATGGRAGTFATMRSDGNYVVSAA